CPGAPDAGGSPKPIRCRTPPYPPAVNESGLAIPSRAVARPAATRLCKRIAVAAPLCQFPGDSETLGTKDEIGEVCKAGNGDVGLRLCSLDRSDAGACRWAVHPDGRKAQSLSRNDVVIDALSYMENAVRGGLDSAQCQLKNFERWLVRLRLLRRDDFIK